MSGGRAAHFWRFLLAAFLPLVAVFLPPRAEAACISVHEQRAGDHLLPQVALTSRGVVVVFLERTGARTELLVVQSPDLKTFSAPVSLSGRPAGTETIRPHLVARGDRVIAVWADAVAGDHDVYLAESIDGGLTFDPPRLVAGGSGGQHEPRASILEDGTVFVAFHDSFGSTAQDRGLIWRVRGTRSDDLATWSRPRAIDFGRPGSFDLFPDAAGAGTQANPLLVTAFLRAEDGAEELRVVHSIDGGETFLPAQRFDPGLGRPLPARIAGSARGQWITFAHLIDGDGQRDPNSLADDGRYLDLAVLSSTTAGRSYSRDAPLNITRTLTQQHPALATDDEVVVAGWVDHSSPGRRTIVGRRSDDGGRSFQPEVTLSCNQDGEVGHVALAALGGRRFAVWEEEVGGRFHVRGVEVP